METRTQGYDLTISINNFNLSYNDVGEGKTPIIFLHGYPFDKTMWQAQFDSLSSSNRLIACDIRGFGKSKDEASPLSIDLFANDLIDFMDKLNIDKAVICGLSMGGFIALNAIKRSPNRFEALILCDTQCVADTIEVIAKRHGTIEDIKMDGVKNFNEGFIKSVFHKESIIGKKEIVRQLRAVVFSNSQHIIIEGLAALAERSETCSTLGDIDIPTLIICGRADEVTPIARSEFMNKNIKGSVLRVIENAGHVSNLEEPEEFNKYLREFLTNLNHTEVVGLIGNQTIVK